MVAPSTMGESAFERRLAGQDLEQGRRVAWARPGYSPPDFVGVFLHFCVLDLALRIRTAWEPA